MHISLYYFYFKKACLFQIKNQVFRTRENINCYLCQCKVRCLSFTFNDSFFEKKFVFVYQCTIPLDILNSFYSFKQYFQSDRYRRKN